VENNPAVKLLRIFPGESDKYKNQPLYEVIVFEARKQSLSGATVARGIMGFWSFKAKFIQQKLLIQKKK